MTKGREVVANRALSGNPRASEAGQDGGTMEGVSAMRRPALATLAAAVLAQPLPALAQEGMTFYIRNSSSRAVVVELHGPQRTWPGDGQVYVIEPKARKSQMIDCEEGESICYGAWLNGNDRVTWGVGPDKDIACEDCCSICVSKTTTTIDVGQQ
jgi:hypothetical protein